MTSCRVGVDEDLRTFTEFWIVSACAAANKLPPPGWEVPDKSVPTVSVSDVSRRGDSECSLRFSFTCVS
jgi:hypothetical protein